MNNEEYEPGSASKTILEMNENSPYNQERKEKAKTEQKLKLLMDFMEFVDLHTSEYAGVCGNGDLYRKYKEVIKALDDLKKET